MSLNDNFPSIPKIEMSNLITEVPRIPIFDDLKTNRVTSAIVIQKYLKLNLENVKFQIQKH